MPLKFDARRRETSRDTFEFTFTRAGETVTETFTVVFGAQPHTMFHGGVSAFRAAVMAVGEMLADDDGTPTDWELVRTPQPRAHEDDDTTDDTRPAGFCGPDGQWHPWADRHEFTDHKAGSSRRRWLNINLVDDSVILDARVVDRIFAALYEIEAERPTKPQTSS